MRKSNPWNREYSWIYNAGDNFLDIYAKRIALKAASSVVCLKVFSGEKEIRWGSGFIIECDATDNNQFESTIITSASLLKKDATLNTLVDNLKVVVVLSDGEQCDSNIEAHDFHYNLASIKIRLDCSLRIASLRKVDDSIMIEPSTISFTEARSFQLHPHTDLVRLIPGSRLISLGRYHDGGSAIMVAPGKFSIEQCRFDCKELLRSTCRIAECGIGGPLINHNAEVVGVNFFHQKFTPFLPINIVAKWWDHYKKFRAYCRPSFGMELSNFFTKEVCTLEKIILKFPHIKTGIIVDEVTPNSPAHSAGVRSNDIIVTCDGETVRSSLHFFDLTWDKVGKLVSLAMIRRDGSCLDVSMMVAETSPNQFNSWPLPKYG